jgi:hypothetical protein
MAETVIDPNEIIDTSETAMATLNVFILHPPFKLLIVKRGRDSFNGIKNRPLLTSELSLFLPFYLLQFSPLPFEFRLVGFNLPLLFGRGFVSCLHLIPNQCSSDQP